MTWKRDIVVSATVGQLLELIRSSLWQTSVECLPFEVLPIDWDEIGKLSLQQTVAPLVFSAALRMPEGKRPPKEWLLRAYSLIERNRQTHRLLDRCVAETYVKLTEGGLRPILLKGQAYAKVYPEATLRQCGDIDLYIGEKNYQEAYSVSKIYGWESKERFNPQAKHYGCSLNGVKVELHKVAGRLPTPSIDRQFQDWSQSQLLSGRTVQIGGKDIEVPTPVFNVVFVFMHLYHHFLNGGIGLRQVCDWTMLLHIHHKDINVAELEKTLKKFRLLRGWRLFTPIAVEYLGLSENECPLYSKEYRKEADRILSFILYEGNFGKVRQSAFKRPKNYFAGKLYSFHHLTKKLVSKFSIDPKLIIAQYISFVKNGLRQVVRDLQQFLTMKR